MTILQIRLGMRVIAAGLALAAPSVAHAACNVAVQAVSFGSYNALSPLGLPGVGNVHVTCSLLSSFSVSLGPGNGTVANRRMTSGSAQLNYNLYKDAARLFVWGEGAAGVSGLGTNVQLPVYGLIPGGQNVPANIYLDSVSVTVDF